MVCRKENSSDDLKGQTEEPAGIFDNRIKVEVDSRKQSAEVIVDERSKGEQGKNRSSQYFFMKKLVF